MDPAAEVRQWLLSVTTATLGTLAAEAEIEGWPFGSLAPFALAGDGTPILLLSEIAQHTKNLRRDPRLSLFVCDPSASGDTQASWRVTVLGRARPIAQGEIEEAHARYCARVPSAPSYLGTHDFTYFALDPVRVRAIGGFGSIHWLDGAAILRDPLGGGLRQAVHGMISHMNADHEEGLKEIVAAATCAAGGAAVGASGAAPTLPARARIRSIDRAGFLIDSTSPDALRYIGFGREIEAAEAREVFVGLVRDARAKVSG